MDHFNRNTEMLSSIETNSMRVLYYDFPEYLKEDYKSYEYTRFCTILEGEKKVVINNKKEIQYSTDDFLLLPPNSKVEMEIDVPTKALVLELSNHLIDDISKKVSNSLDTDVGNDHNFLFKGELNDNLRYGFNMIKNAYLNDSEDKEFIMDLSAQGLVYSLLKNKGTQRYLKANESNSNCPIAEAIYIMKENITNNITVSEVAFKLNMSVPNFSNKFKKLTSITPNEYLKNLKLAKAKELLAYESVTEVAYDLGYENISYFIKLFKDKYGVTPKKFQTIKQ